MLAPFFVFLSLYPFVGLIKILINPNTYGPVKVVDHQSGMKKYAYFWFAILFSGSIITMLLESPTLVPLSLNLPRSAADFLFWVICWSAYELFRHVVTHITAAVINSRYQ